MASGAFGDMAEDIKPNRPQGSSDTPPSTPFSRFWCGPPRAVSPMAKTMLVPESWSKQAEELPEAWRDMYSPTGTL